MPCSKKRLAPLRLLRLLPLLLTTSMGLIVTCAPRDLAPVHGPTTPPDHRRRDPRPHAPGVYSLSTSAELDELTTRRETWRTSTTPSFVIFHFDRDLAGRIAAAAEQQRALLLQHWGVTDAQPAWRPRCQIAVYRTNADLVQMTGGSPKAGSAAAREARLSPGAMLSRRITLAADDHTLLTATLPHEITHIIVGDALGGQAPLWANEGMASLAERGWRRRYGPALTRAAASRRLLIPLERLIAMTEYPADPRERFLFYAQSASVVAFLASLRGGAPGVLALLRQARHQGLEAALRQRHGIDGIGTLEQRWTATLDPP